MVDEPQSAEGRLRRKAARRRGAAEADLAEARSSRAAGSIAYAPATDREVRPVGPLPGLRDPGVVAII
jgi:hypothetical protein